MKNRQTWSRAAAVLLLIQFATGCDRPFVDPAPPDVEVIEPEISDVVTNAEPEVAVRATSSRSIESVSLNGQPMQFSQSDQLWKLTIELRQGINPLVISAVDAEEAATTDTAFVFHMTAGISPGGPRLPEPRGGHTTTLLDNGALIVIGGSRFPESQAIRTVLQLPPGGTAFESVSAQLRDARVGHTASLLPDGRILVIGGSRLGDVGSISDLVESVEIYNPLTGSFRIVPFRGEPIRRAYHTASIRVGGSGIVVDLFGGRGDVQYTPSPQLGTRGDIRSFHFRNDSLIALSPAPGPSIGIPVWGHVQAPLEDEEAGALNRYLIAGTSFSGGFAEDAGLIIDYSSIFDVEILTTSDLMQPRMRHAAETLSEGVVAIFGGFAGIPNSSLGQVEIFAEEAGRYFQFSALAGMTPRYGLTATKISSRRILLLGGFTGDGQGVLNSDLFLTSPF